MNQVNPLALLIIGITTTIGALANATLIGLLTGLLVVFAISMTEYP